jgi:hypothetical protein
MTDKLGIPITIILAALIVAAAIAFSLRWEFIVVPNGGHYRVDRWQGTIAMCVPDRTIKFQCAAEWAETAEGKVAPK